MRQGVIWFVLSCKRYLKHPFFLLALFLLPIGAFGVSRVQSGESAQIRIAVWSENADKSSLEGQLLDSLTGEPQESGSLFLFYACDSDEAVREEVETRRAECGYVIGKGLEEKLDSGNSKKMITVYSAPSTVTASLSTETVSAALLKLYDRHLLENYVRSGNAFSAMGEAESEARETAAKAALERYDKWLENGGTFQFQYVYGEEAQNGTQKNRAAGAGVFPVRGMAAVCVFALGLYSAVILRQDEKKGLFKTLAGSRRFFCTFASLGAPVCLALLSALLALKTGGCLENPMEEIIALLQYGMMVILFSWALKTILPREGILAACIPFFLVGSLIFCPVFVDGGRFIPEIRKLQPFFLPWYYLKCF